MCFPYWWCTKHVQLIMGTWPIYKKRKKTLLTTDLNKSKRSFDKISPHDFYFFLSFQSVLVLNNTCSTCLNMIKFLCNLYFVPYQLDSTLTRKLTLITHWVITRYMFFLHLFLTQYKFDFDFLHVLDSSDGKHPINQRNNFIAPYLSS